MPRLSESGLSYRLRLLTLSTVAGMGCFSALPVAAQSLTFTPGDLVISVYGDGDGSGSYADNAASPITLDEVTTTAAPSGTLQTVGQLVLPQTQTTANGITNYAISGEYGSSSEGTLQLSGNGQYLTIAGYGVTASTYNANPASFGGGTKTCLPSGTTCFPLAQTSSVPGYAASSAAAAAGYTSTITVPRVVALVGANGSVDTSTALYSVFNENNPRSVATANGSTLYVSGQGASKSDTATTGLFVANKGASSATQIWGTVDTRTVSIQNNQLYLSTDSTAGSGVTENISSFGTAGHAPTSAATPTVLANIASKYTVTSLAALNAYEQTTLPSNVAYTSVSKTKGIVYLSPENYFFANASTLYVADSGAPKGDNNGSGSSAQGLADGGLQKWSLIGNSWVLDYTITAGLLNLVPDTTACASTSVTCGTTGLIGLAGEVVGDTVDLFATNATLSDLDQTYLYGIDDVLSDTLPSQVTGESFTVLQTAAADTNIRGVSFAPVPEPASMTVMASGLIGCRLLRRRRKVA
jgi:hypothetical protein